jgi:two-component system response regulator VicR
MPAKKILIAEDEPALLEILSEKIESLGHIAQTADNGLAALETYFTFRPDLVLLDIMMPEKTGFEVLQEIKEKEGTIPIPIIVLSNLDQGDEIELCRHLGAVDYIIKANVSLKQISSTLEYYLTPVSVSQ